MTPNHCTWDTQCMLKGALSFCKRWVGLPAQPRGALQRLVPDALPHCLVRSGFSCEDHRFLGICLNGNGERVTLPMDFGSSSRRDNNPTLPRLLFHILDPNYIARDQKPETRLHSKETPSLLPPSIFQAPRPNFTACCRRKRHRKLLTAR